MILVCPNFRSVEELFGISKGVSSIIYAIIITNHTEEGIEEDLEP